MKEGIHPEYLAAKVVCACGASYETHSTRGSFSVEVCANCHPFYTGKQKLMDTAGRVDRFRRKYGSSKEIARPEEDVVAEPAKALPAYIARPRQVRPRGTPAVRVLSGFTSSGAFRGSALGHSGTPG
jgi:large subunit ribosomal protein L31